MSEKIDCPCQSIQEINRNILLQEFDSLRDKCPVLKKILVPDNIWPIFKQKMREPPDSVGHKYKILGAFQLGILSKITLPLHRYLMDNKNDPKNNLQERYKNELTEKWMVKETTLERHQKARGHEGKINELLCASFLQDRGWRIDNLEALGGDFDIEATSNNNEKYSIEVKYIGQQDEKFKEHETSCITNNAVAGTIPIYDGYNYFLFRVYEASKQLQKSNNNRLAIIVYSHQAWQMNEMPINDNWIAHQPIKFAKSASIKWDKFLSKEKERKCCTIEDNLDRCINELDAIWVVQQKANLDYSLEKIIERKTS